MQLYTNIIISKLEPDIEYIFIVVYQDLQESKTAARTIGYTNNAT